VAQSTQGQTPAQKAAPRSSGALYLDINTASEAQLKALLSRTSRRGEDTD
jgi:hypothetical protein